MKWKPAKAQRRMYADGPRQTAKSGRCELEVFEWCSNKNGSCPSGDFSYVVSERGRVRAAGPHGDRFGMKPRGMHQSIDQAKRAAEKRVRHDPRVIKICRR